MEFIDNGQKIEFKAVYDWVDVYINNRMILHRISKADAQELITVITAIIQ